MDLTEWEPEYFAEDYFPEWGDPEAFPFPSPSAAVAQRLFPSRRRPTPARARPRPVGASATPATAAATPMTGVLARIRELDERQRATTAQLAMLQQRTAAQQSSEQFGPLATGAAGALALGFTNGDLFSPTVTHALPVMQLLLASRGRAISSGFRANPWSTVGFPAAAILLGLFRDRIPGVGPTVVEAPVLSFFPGQAGIPIVSVAPQKNVRFRFTLENNRDPADPSTGSPDLIGPIQLRGGDRIKIRGFADNDKTLGPVVSYTAIAIPD